MSTVLQYGLIAFSLFLLIIIIYLLRRGRISIKYSLVWIFTGFAMLIATIIPYFMDNIANFLGFELASNMVFMMLISFLMLITLSLTVIVSSQSEKIRLLIQEVSMLKESQKSNEKK